MIPFGELRWSDIRGRPVWRWATVTATSPTLSLTIDGDADPIGVPPTVPAHVGTIDAGDRVWVQIQPGGAVVVIGKAA